MGVDFYPCSRCNKVYCDCGDFVICDEESGGCGRDWCSDFCAKEDGYKECYCKLDKELELGGYCDDGCEMYKDKWDSCSSVKCSNFVRASCNYCRGEVISDDNLLTYALDLLGLTKEELQQKYKEN